MQPQQLDSLGERLLRSGIAPRHVRRYLRELRDHYDDALREELKMDVTRATAEKAAASRLGEPESLVQSALAQQELRSTVARYPRLVFGAGPMLVWVALSLTVHFILPEVAHSREGKWALYGTTIFFVRIFPVFLTLGLLVIAYRQRLPLLWPIVGAAIVAILAGTLDIGLSPAETFAESSLGIDSSLLPFFFDSPVLGPASPAALAEGLMRAILTMTLAVAPFMYWSRQQ